LIAARAAADTVTLAFENGERELASYPQKRPLIRLTSRPPQLETPFSVFDEGLLTPNDAFFVRYHLSGIPTAIDPKAHRIAIRGLVAKPLELSVDDLKELGDPVDLVAVNQCSGNSRGFFSPRVPGGQLGNGAMGNARWTGVPLKRVLEKAGVVAGARQVTFRGLDKAPLDVTPAFVKALDIDHALDGEVMVAYAMNGADIPMLNGFPVRLVVPGYYGTYWIKHLSQIEVIGDVFAGFWMSAAYRVPDNPGHSIEPGQKGIKTIPIGRLNVRSFITSLADSATIPSRNETLVRGIAFDRGAGIREVFFSSDEGRTWREAALSRDIGRYSFREWKIGFTPPAPGHYTLQVRAVNRIGETQPSASLWNASGYMRNVVESVHVSAV
jgi:DMSO/TMAO reductase YedYZ molybdopterin-dependent catalytic subunit